MIAAGPFDDAYAVICCAVDEPFGLEVTDGEDAETEVSASRAELWEALRSGSVSARTLYRVGARERLPAGLIDRVFDAAHETRRAAKRELELHAALGLAEEDGLDLLRGVGEGRLSVEPALAEPTDNLTFDLRHRPYDSYVPVVREVYDSLREHARVGALRTLAALGTREAEEAIRDIVLAHAGDEEFKGLWFVWAGDAPNHPDVFFPRLFELLADERHRADVIDLCLNLSYPDAADEDALAPYADLLVTTARDIRRAVKRRQKRELGEWRWAESYESARREAGLVLDLLGRLPGEDAGAELVAALDLTDPWLLAWALAGLARRGDDLPTGPLATASADPESRWVVFEALRDAGRLDEMPEQHRTQAALAESDLVRWCSFPTELSQPPGEIELMDVVGADEGDVYVFRFRGGPEWHEQRDEWVAGVAGPFPKDADPPEPHGSRTFSSFVAWAEHDARGHVEAIGGFFAGLEER